MYHRLYLHLAWTTLERAPLIDTEVAGFLCRFLRSVARRERAYILEIGMVQTHVHALVRIHPTVNVSRLVQRLKALSATVANREVQSSSGQQLRWANGYAAKTVCTRHLEALRTYLKNQPSHHPLEAIPDWGGDTLAEFDISSPRQLMAE